MYNATLALDMLISDLHCPSCLVILDDHIAVPVVQVVQRRRRDGQLARGEQRKIVVGVDPLRHAGDIETRQLAGMVVGELLRRAGRKVGVLDDVAGRMGIELPHLACAPRDLK
jgi:hypothetical protein